MSTQEIKSQQGLRWTNIIRPSAKDKSELKSTFSFHDADFKDAFRSTFRSQIVIRENYTYMILVVPIFDPVSRTIQIDEVDTFIGKDWIVTIHDGKIPSLKELWEELKTDKKKLNELLNDNCSKFIAKMLHEVIDRTYPMIDHIDQELEKIKNAIYDETEDRRSLVKEILRMRQNITDMRKAVRGYSGVFQHFNDTALQKGGLIIFSDNKLLEGLVNDAADIWEALDSNKEEVEALQEANDGLIGHNLNEIFKTLTGIS
ncbi:MAG: hypothetical protein CO132_06345, partial [Candidatus Kerfeldbacteria bacterium CG_4_9_14_3_um_filter_45_8]